MSMQHIAEESIFEEVSFRADRAKLSGRLYQPSGSPKAAIVIHGATGVPQSFYRHFAGWLATEGYTCLTYDYRDTGASATGHLKNSKATMAEWGVADQPAAQRALEKFVPDTPVWAIGHSLGGMMLPFHEGASRLSRVITVASGPVHLRDHPWPYRGVAAAFWWGPAPGLVRLLGYLPARWLGMGPDLPKGVYWQWRKWCTTAGFTLSDVGYSLPLPDWKAVQAPVKLIAVADDDLVPPTAVWRLMQQFPEAAKKQLVLRPAEFGLRKIGHVGAFRRENSSVWPKLIAFD